MTPAEQITALLAQKPSRAVWQKICGVLYTAPGDALDAPLAAVEAGLATWPDDLNEGHLWPLPPRQALREWAESIAKGRGPSRTWAVVTFLQLHNHFFGAEGSAALFANPALATLTHLYLAQCHLGPIDLARLLDSPHTGALTHLVLSGNGLGEGCAAKLLPHTLGQQLHMLDIGDNRLGASDLDALLTTPMPKLHRLCLTPERLGRARLEDLLDADTLPAITVLSIRGVTLELARTARGHDHIKRALWSGWLLERETQQLKDLARERAIPSRTKLSRQGLIDALRKLDP